MPTIRQSNKACCLIRAVVLGLAIYPRIAGADAGSDLVEAIRRTGIVAMRRALDAGGGANSRGPEGTPVLMLAALQADVRCVRLLLDRGADPNATDAGGSTALMWAISDHAKAE